MLLNYEFSAETAVQFAWCTLMMTNGAKMLKFKSTANDTRFPQYTYLMLSIKPQFHKTPVVAESK